MPNQIRAIFRAQALSMWKLGRGESGILRAVALIPALLWYAMWAALAFVAAVVLPEAERRELGPLLAWAFFGLFLYWQLAPVFTTARGASLDLNKLLIYPIPARRLFAVEVLLRITTGAESMILLAGIAVGLVRHTAVPGWAPLAGAAGFGVFNLLFAAGLRNLIDRMLSYRRVREIAALLAVTLIVLPQALTASGVSGRKLAEFWNRHPGIWPWTAAGSLATEDAAGAGVLILWTAGAALFGYHQFRRRLSFDPHEAGAARRKPSATEPWTARLYRLPALLFRDPAAAILEKELRSLARSSRFRVQFVMGFSFGVLVWFPMAKRSGSFNENFPVLVTLYALLLLGEPLIWNVFGQDRASAQFYFSVPVPISGILAAKNVAAFVFVFAEVSMVLLVCAALPFPLNPARVLEAYAVALASTVYLTAAGNLTSVYSARPVNPDQTWGNSGFGKVQFLILLFYPALGAPVGLAYAARYGFESEAAFYGVLGAVTLMGLIIHRVATASAISAVERRKEQFVGALSSAGGPLAG